MAGNLYVADMGNNRIRTVTVNESSLNYPTATAVGNTDSAHDPLIVTVSNIGNAALTFPAAWPRHQSKCFDLFRLDAATTCPELTSGSSDATLVSGDDCKYAIDFEPIMSGAVNGSAVVTDNSLAVNGSRQSISLSGTAIAVGTTHNPVELGEPIQLWRLGDDHRHGGAQFRIGASLSARCSSK